MSSSPLFEGITWSKKIPSTSGVYFIRLRDDEGVLYDAHMFEFEPERGMLATVDGTWIDEFDDRTEWAGPFHPKEIPG